MNIFPSNETTKHQQKVRIFSVYEAFVLSRAAFHVPILFILIPDSGKTNTSTEHHQKVKYKIKKIKRETPANFLFTSFFSSVFTWRMEK